MTMSIIVLIVSFAVAFALDPCRFEYPGRGVIDLTSLGRTDGKATYADQKPAIESDYKYSYNPCKPFTEGSVCQNVSACQFRLDGTQTYAIGVQQTASWNPGSGAGANPYISYIYGEKTTVVKLECSTTGEEEFEVLGEDPINVYIFRLKHKCACWDGCKDASTTTTATTTTTKISTTPAPTADACQFVHPEKGIIDFSFIGRTDEKAAYADEITRTTSNFKYSYNPCRSFSQGSGCIGAAVCQVSYDGQETFTLGTQESAWWDIASNKNAVSSLNYVYGDKKVSVLLRCSNEGNNEFEAYGEDPMNTFKFQLTHQCACWNGCSKANTTNTSHMSTK